jgi:hypothetical protein
MGKLPSVVHTVKPLPITQLLSAALFSQDAHASLQDEQLRQRASSAQALS